MRSKRTLRTIGCQAIGAATVALVLVLAVGCGDSAVPAPPEDRAVQSSGTARAILRIEGMACSSCAATVRAMLQRTPGVERADVSARRAEGIVEFDPARVEPAELVGVVERLGYRARVTEETGTVPAR